MTVRFGAAYYAEYHRDDIEAAALYDLIETQVAPRFYDVDE